MKAISAYKLSLAVLLTILIPILGLVAQIPRTEHYKQTCSTFLLEKKKTVLVGHNLDDYIEVPGLVVFNPRNISKHSISWHDLNSFFGRGEPALRWVSKYGSITYNTFGKEFIDGGMNEAGLYVGEMTLFGTEYPKDKQLIRLYHHQWMQYLLDNFQSVEEVMRDLARVTVDGHCQWHFFIADSARKSAVIEFLKGQVLIHANEQMPVKVLCNRRYGRELDTLKLYAGFGGTRAVDFADTTDDHRFVWAVDLLKRPRDNSETSNVNYAFSILQQLDLGNNRWSIVYDLKNLRMYFNTYKSRHIRFVDLRRFDLPRNSQAMILDINRDLAGDVISEFAPFSDAIHMEYVRKAWNEIDTGFFGNLFFKPMMVRRLSTYIQDFRTIND